MNNRISGRGPRLVLVGLVGVAVVMGIVTWIRQSGSQTDEASTGKEFEFRSLADAGAYIAAKYTGPVRDTNSLQELRASIEARGSGGLAALRAQRDALRSGPVSDERAFFNSYCVVQHEIAGLLLYEGRFEEATKTFDEIRGLVRSANISGNLEAQLEFLLGVMALRQGEVENCVNCVGPSSCIFPIPPAAVHQYQAGSRAAIQHFTACLEQKPDNLEARWLLNLAYMTVAEYPDKVPPQYLVPLDTFRSKLDVGRFTNVASLVGLTSRGTNTAGGSVFDDFTGDGLPDLFVVSLDVDKGASLFVNRGDGTFEERSASAGLADQVYALNVVRGDYDNDGKLDVLLLRGGWEAPMRLSLLHNKGGGVFEDVTVKAGLSMPIASEAAAWCDYDNDGLLDLFVSGEYEPRLGASADLRNRCRLYHNQGDGTFVDVAATAGVLNERRSKGCAWGDYDGDGWPDLFVSNMGQPCRLYHNEKGTFRDVAPELGIAGPEGTNGPEYSFSCWFWDYDNDGRLDIYVNDYSTVLTEAVAGYLGMPEASKSRPRLFRNLGPAGFRDVTKEVGLDRAMMPMGCNFGDIDKDGYLDIYLGTGRMDLATLVPNLMFKNVDGQRFEDVTLSSGTGHLQKGHGVSFADWDCDGNLDFFVESGGAVPGDRSYNLLFQNPGNDRHWLKVKLIGTKTNRAAIGAEIRAVVKDAEGKRRSIYRTIGNNSSFGGNSLVEFIGLRESKSVEELVIHWPTSKTTQTFRDVAGDQAIQITEGTESFTVLKQPRLSVPSQPSAPAPGKQGKAAKPSH